MTCYLTQTKGDRRYAGTTFKAPALSRLCPIEAYAAWAAAARLTEGPVFRAIDRWGHVSESSLHPDSLVTLLRSMLANASVASADLYSGHSLRRGFANWATANGWDLKTLMEYVGWKNVQSAMRYVEGADPFAKHRVDRAAACEVIAEGETTIRRLGQAEEHSRAPAPHMSFAIRFSINVSL
jgi:hypothetical protein